jgi:D-inositol-3-phosphate glycosyltransferase
LDLTIQAFATWWHSCGKPDNAFLYLHCSRHDVGYDVVQLAQYFGIAKHMIMSKTRLKPNEFIAEADLPKMYRMLDMQINTGTGEGWGLTTHEGMACGIMQVVPNWAALGEWPRGAVHMVSIESLVATPRGVNVIGGVPSMVGLVQAIDRGYRDASWRREWAQKALLRATETQFDWVNVAQKFDDVFRDVIEEKRDANARAAAEANGSYGKQAADHRPEEIATT